MKTNYTNEEMIEIIDTIEQASSLLQGCSKAITMFQMNEDLDDGESSYLDIIDTSIKNSMEMLKAVITDKFERQ